MTLCRRFVDRDMLMRYHVGLGVGHVYSHCSSGSDHSSTNNSQQRNIFDNEHLEENDRPSGIGEDFQLEQEESSTDDDMDNSQDSQEEDAIDDDELYAMEEMYGS